ncbi:MAG: enoyl-CoA hydratase/carnithine racemase [Halioglobus sp.]|jgi:enoyl-CoA hydratase/carnithine racemase
MTDTIVYQKSGHVGRLILNNPAKHNALGREQLEGIQRCLEEVADDEEVRVLVLTGNGEKTFCAGASLQELSGGEIGDDAFQAMTLAFSKLAIPTICALNGNVFGGGVELALSCDFRIGVKGSRMRVPAAVIGLCYPLSGIQQFVARLGPHIAKRILVASEEFDADTMLQIGLLDHLVPVAELEAATEKLAQRIAGLAPLAVQAMKSILQEAAQVNVDVERAASLSKMCLDSEDIQEGFAAKREKREPQFKGR